MKSLFPTLLTILTVVAPIEATIIHIPDDQPTVQVGIDAASEGDTILVQSGVYPENINFNGKNIVVGSLFLTTDDTAYITQTVINGNGTGSVVSFESGEDSTATLIGFTVTNGHAGLSGGGIRCWDASPNLEHLVISDNEAYGWGGGIWCQDSSPIIRNCMIRNNTAGDEGGGILCSQGSPRLENVRICNNKVTYYGGGLACWDASPVLENVTISGNIAYHHGGGVSLLNSTPSFDPDRRCNIYLNYSVRPGHELFSDSPHISVSVDTFTVLNPGEAHISPADNFDMDILQSIIAPIEADLYVSPLGNDSNSGLTPSDPLRTLFFSLQKIAADSLHPHSIFLVDGRYSTTSTGEFFPVKMVSHVSLIGESRDGVILDAERPRDDFVERPNVMYLSDVRGISVENMTITGGEKFNSLYGEGGGISCSGSDFRLVNVIITGNNGSDGGGLYVSHSHAALVDVTIVENIAHCGGGVYCTNATLSLLNVAINSNSARIGGGIVFDSNADASLENVIIRENEAEHSGGGMYFNNGSEPSLVNVTIDMNTAGWGGGGISCRRSAPYFERVSITRNEAPHGGGVYCSEANPYFVKATFSMNAASYGGALKCSDQSHPRLVNCILWNDDPQEIYFSEVSEKNAITIYYSDVQDSIRGIKANNNGIIYWMSGNIDADPDFVAPHDGNFDLSIGSPCIDKGIQDTALVYYIRSDPETLFVPPLVYIGRAPNMGAFETEPGCFGGEVSDVNGDKVTNILDLVPVAHHIIGLFVLSENERCRADCNGDTNIDIQDVIGIVSVILRTGGCGP